MMHIYWIKFPDRQPFKIVAKHIEELIDLLLTEMARHHSHFEWLIRE